MPKPKYKKVNPNQQSEQVKLTVTINSDGNVIELQNFSNGIYVFKYTKSETKLGQLLTLTEDQYREFIETNNTLKLSRK